MKYKLLDNSTNTYAIILESGDHVMKTIQEFAKVHSLKASRFTGVGALSKATLGYFDYSIKDYKKIQVSEQVELLSMIGNISLFGDEPKVHAHVVLGKSDGAAVGGHLLTAVTHPTLEIILEEMPGYLQRRIDEETGLPLIDID